jgi:hypothetical protein
MGRNLTAVLSAATFVAALGLSGCSNSQHAGPSETEPTPPAASVIPTATTQVAPLPPREALAGVLYRLADPAVPGSQKLNLVQGATPDNAAALDQFSAALVNGGFAPMKVDVRDVAWSDRNPADVVADVNMSSSDPRGPRFSFPMEFTPYQGGWQLSARTADVLLAYSPAHDASTAPAPGH